MTETLASRVERVKALDEKRTQGDWETRDYGEHTPKDLSSDGKELAFIQASTWQALAAVVVRMEAGEDGELLEEEPEGRANLNFIANAPEMASLVSELWTELQSVTKERDELKFRMDGLDK
jgi:hypothetical protein